LRVLFSGDGLDDTTGNSINLGLFIDAKIMIKVGQSELL